MERDTSVISWAQVEIDGLRGAPLELAAPGVSFRWSGQALRVAGGSGPLRLTDAMGASALRARAARSLRKFAALQPPVQMPAEPEEDSGAEDRLVVTDGRQAWVGRLVERRFSGRLLVFTGGMPPAQADLWLVRRPRLRATAAETAGVICFTPGTRIRTPGGEVAVQDLRPGDRVETRDDGPQEICWTAGSRISGARLHVEPWLRPVLFRAGALGIGRPDAELRVSPGHRMLVQGAAARALFNTEEVLVAAGDLVDGRAVVRDYGLAEVSYIHLMFARHQVVLANGLACESFHPGAAALDRLDPQARAALAALMPGGDAGSYGPTARRCLDAAEAAILRYGLAA